MLNIIGLGYIGLPTALMFASHKVEVIGTDYNKELVYELQRGFIPFEEKGLKELFAHAMSSGISFTTEYQSTDMYVVAVPTPYDKRYKKIDSSYVVKAVETILDISSKGAIIVIESTVSPGTIDRYIRPIIVGKGVHHRGKIFILYMHQRE